MADIEDSAFAARGAAAYPSIFVRRLAHGVCVGVGLPDANPAEPWNRDWPIPDELAPRERARARALTGARRPGFVGGRLALRRALMELGLAPQAIGAIGASDRGAPVLATRAVGSAGKADAGVTGSISHKRGLAVALAAFRGGEDWVVGVDIEARTPPSRDISRRVLTDAERRELAELDGAERAHAVLLRFSIKEAIYKAVDPFVRRYVGFAEVAVHPRPDGSVEVRPMLSPGPRRPLAIEAAWTSAGEFFLCTARAHATP